MSQSVSYSDPVAALAEAQRLYSEQARRVSAGYQDFIDGTLTDPIHGYYPELSFEIKAVPRIINWTQAYGFCTHKGTYTTTITRPDVMGDYYRDQLERIVENHGIDIHVGLSNTPIPLPYALDSGKPVNGKISADQNDLLQAFFDQPDPRYFITDSDVSNPDNQKLPMAWYNAVRTDRSLNSLKHYTGTDPKFFQKYILFANYGDYIDAFETRARQILLEEPSDSQNPYIALVAPGNKVTLNENVPDARENFDLVRGETLTRDPQMPAYHLVRKDGLGVSIVNIGVGSPNAKTITDHVAVLRPHAWFMIGHCAGLSHSQKVGDYVLPIGFVHQTGVIKDIFSNLGYVHIPEISEIHTSLTKAIRGTLGIEETDFKSSVRSGVNITVDDRNWEAPDTREGLEILRRNLASNNAISLEMEAGTISANGFKHRVPYGSLLCVSDKPLHGQPKLEGMALDFYRARVIQQFDIAMATIDNVRQMGDKVHSRKMRSDFSYVPFR